MKQYELVAVTDGTVPRASIAAAVNMLNARIYEPQLGVHVTLTAYEVRTDLPPDNSPMRFLTDFRNELAANPSDAEAKADVTMAFVARDLYVGSQSYAGLAQYAPACSAYAAGVMQGNNYQVLAHELGHTLGMDHTSDGLMSGGESLSDTLSAVSLSQFAAQSLDCMPDWIPPSVAPAAVSVAVTGANDMNEPSTGGGAGSLETFMLGALLVLVIAAWRSRR